MLPVVSYECKTWVLTLMEEGILIIFDNMTLWKIFGLQKKEVNGACSNCTERNFMTLPPRRQIQVLLVWSNQGQWHVCDTWKAWEKLERKQGFRWTSWMEGHFGRPKHTYIKRCLKQGMRSWIIFVLAQGRIRCRVVMNRILNVRFP